MTIGDSGGVAVPLSILLTGLAAMFGYMAFRPWPGTSGKAGNADKPVTIVQYIQGILIAKPPPEGVAPGTQDVPAIEAGIWLLLGAWVVSKLYQLATPFKVPILGGTASEPAGDTSEESTIEGDIETWGEDIAGDLG